MNGTFFSDWTKAIPDRTIMSPGLVQSFNLPGLDDLESDDDGRSDMSDDAVMPSDARSLRRRRMSRNDSLFLPRQSREKMVSQTFLAADVAAELQRYKAENPNPDGAGFLASDTLSQINVSARPQSLFPKWAGAADKAAVPEEVGHKSQAGENATCGLYRSDSTTAQVNIPIARRRARDTHRQPLPSLPEDDEQQQPPKSSGAGSPSRSIRVPNHRPFTVPSAAHPTHDRLRQIRHCRCESTNLTYSYPQDCEASLSTAATHPAAFPSPAPAQMAAAMARLAIASAEQDGIPLPSSRSWVPGDDTQLAIRKVGTADDARGGERITTSGEVGDARGLPSQVREKGRGELAAVSLQRRRRDRTGGCRLSDEIRSVDRAVDVKTECW